ncbi:hypothetical protein F383_15464 [Gossypium arboreum]|uniref:Uncharacterized protein n=1 Tax=Gossypium arboreum TaxID=29729 RepID=A0A0B0NFZ8_GOSAR|nr:hypothetical protein F383_15464 [Gossypium arboreum]
MSRMLALFDICDYLSILFNSEWFNGKYQVKIECEIELKCQISDLVTSSGIVRKVYHTINCLRYFIS